MSNGNGSGNGGTIIDLTAKERQVLGHAARGVTRVRDLARELGMSSDGVRRHIERIYEKLAVSTLADAIAIETKLHAGTRTSVVQAATMRRYSSDDPENRKFHVAHTGD